MSPTSIARIANRSSHFGNLLYFHYESVHEPVKATLARASNFSELAQGREVLRAGVSVECPRNPSQHRTDWHACEAVEARRC